jgi:Kef-type K+ transport system membrane component KefB
VALTGILGVLVPFGLGFAVVLLLPDLWGTQVQNRLVIFALFMGTALSISALPIIARILVDLNLMQKETGVVVMAAATINDLIGWTLFALILSALTPGGSSAEKPWVALILTLGFSVAIVYIGRLIGRPALRWLRTRISWPSGFIAATSIMILAAAVAAEAIGIHAIFGAFLLGVALGRSHAERNQDHDTIYQFAVSFFAPLYFVSIGLKVNFIEHFDFMVSLIILLTACVGKICGAGLGAFWGGMKLKEALVVGFGMNARGAMEIILASVALKHNLIDQRIFVALIFMALITSLLSGPVMQRLMRGESS